MNLILYSLDSSKIVKWASDNNADTLLAELKTKCASSVDIDGEGVLLCADDETVSILTKYAAENVLVSKHNTKQIESFVGKIPMQECFYILNGDSVFDIVRLSAYESLNKSNRTDIKAVQDSFNAAMDSYADLIKNYTLYAFGYDDLPCRVGESDRDKRVCRFCDRTGREFFKDVAHAIPEALGNKLLFCNEECDVCNHTLNQIEDNLIALMDVRRAVFRIKRKDNSSVPQIDGQDFVIRDDGNGYPLIYVMEETLPKDWQKMEVLPIRLNLKYKTTNENIYKALVKIAIDLIPSQYLDEFKETIDWLKSDGHFMPDSLPSCFSAILPKGVFYEQPQLLLYVKHDEKHEGPFCFALLRIYDMCYRYIVPFAKSDKGKYRTDDSLKFFWSEFETQPLLDWRKQDTSEWWQSAPWAEFGIKRTAPFLRIAPSTDSVFDKCRERPMPQEIEFPNYDADNIDIEFKTLTFKDYAKKRIVSQEELANTNNDSQSIVFIFDNRTTSIKVDFSFIAHSAEDKHTRYFGSSLSAYVYSDDYSNQIDFDDTEIYGVNGDFIAAIWDKVIAEASRQIDNKKRLTQFRKINIGKYFTSLNTRFFRESLYIFINSKGEISRIPFKCLHEDMSESKRKELIMKANGRL